MELSAFFEIRDIEIPFKPIRVDRGLYLFLISVEVDLKIVRRFDQFCIKALNLADLQYSLILHSTVSHGESTLKCHSLGIRGRYLDIGICIRFFLFDLIDKMRLEMVDIDIERLACIEVCGIAVCLVRILPDQKNMFCFGGKIYAYFLF